MTGDEDGEDDDDESVPECLSCGTCCFSTLPEYVRVTGDDHARLGGRADALTHFIGNRCYMRLAPAGHCAALALDAVGRRFVCSVYEQRPETCRELARGSPACAGERFAKSARPPSALDARAATRPR